MGRCLQRGRLLQRCLLLIPVAIDRLTDWLPAFLARALLLQVVVGDESSWEMGKDVCGLLLQYPATDGSIHDFKVGTGQ